MIPTIEEAKGVELIGYHDLDGRPGFKMGLQRHGSSWFLYLAHFWHSGWTIIDVTDPTAPRHVRFVEGPPHCRTAQIQVADGRMIVGIERPVYGGAEHFDEADGGAHILDVGSDPTAPRLLGRYRSGGDGTHRNFYAGGRYLWATVRSRAGVSGGLMAVVDIADPADPVERAHWSWSRSGLPSALGRGDPTFHGPAYVRGDRAFLSFGHEGMVILDVEDPTEPTLVSRVSFGDFDGTLGCHSAIPIADGHLVVANSEATREGYESTPSFVAVIDIEDEEHPRILSTFATPRPSSASPFGSYYEKGGRFGPHNQHHHQGHPDLHQPRSAITMTYFSGGLRIFSITDPYAPDEVAFFVPGPPERRHGPRPRGALVSHLEDVLIDARGIIYCTDPNQGLFILRSEQALA